MKNGTGKGMGGAISVLYHCAYDDAH